MEVLLEKGTGWAPVDGSTSIQLAKVASHILDDRSILTPCRVGSAQKIGGDEGVRRCLPDTVCSSSCLPSCRGIAKKRRVVKVGEVVWTFGCAELYSRQVAPPDAYKVFAGALVFRVVCYAVLSTNRATKGCMASHTQKLYSSSRATTVDKGKVNLIVLNTNIASCIHES